MGKGGDSALRVAVVDGYPLARQGLRAFLEAAADVAVVAEAAGSHEALRAIADTAPDIVLLGFELECGPHGVELCRRLKAAPAALRVVVLTGHNHAEAMLPFLLAGADSYVHGLMAGEEIVAAVRRTAAGERVWNEDDLGQAAALLRADAAAVGLTARELEVLTLKRHRHTNADIAARLHVSRHTVKHHVSSIKRKLAMAGAARI